MLYYSLNACHCWYKLLTRWNDGIAWLFPSVIYDYSCVRTCRLNENRRLSDFRNLYQVPSICTPLVHIALPIAGPETTVEMRPEAVVLKGFQFNIRSGRAKHKRNQNTVTTAGEECMSPTPISADRMVTNNVNKFYFHFEAPAINRAHVLLYFWSAAASCTRRFTPSTLA